MDSSCICMMEYQYLRQQRCSVIPHIISHWPETRCHTYSEAALQLDPELLTLCPLWLAGKQALVLYSKTQCCSVVTGEDNGALSAKCVWLSQIANRRQRRWVGTGQAQCLHKHIDIQTDQTDAHRQTCGAVGRIDAQQLQHCLHGGVVQ